MYELCHRCGEELSGLPNSSYCPHCGAPQLYLRDYMPSDPGPDSTGAAAPPPPPDPRQIEWQMALRCAAVVAGGGAVLSLLSGPFPLLGLLCWGWIVSGSVIALGLYQKQRPLAWIDAGVGARIGLVVGLAMTAALALATSIMGLVARFGLKNMGDLDHEMSIRIHASITQMAATNPVPTEWLGIFYSQEFIAGMMLTVFASMAIVLIAVSTAGGAFAGMMRTRARLTPGN
ncbi:zinc ribbon domain-containing protein [Granulicella sp. WH15]|uniref:zinc ribbon domain-containing protein n=1 Tax=Granulicella sp. WH15 TaxID=2602070 RepID=UPI001366BAD2|nr:zinc ribbon domain-containing protein [Granulicella sp. WH15]QHN02037.1 zinc ribbon domain-containing protein [Granulicella sp. WH15]